MSEISATIKNLSVFSLVRTKKDCYYSSATVDYTPLKKYKFLQSSSNQTAQTILPKFNRDQKFYTPAFINPYQNARLKENSVEALMKEKEKFLKKLEICDQSANDQIPVFNPRDDNYCSLCKVSFKCYWAHVNEQMHLKRIKSNKFNNYIHQLCRKKGEKEEMDGQTMNKVKKCVGKKKKIIKRSKKQKVKKEAQTFTKQDFIIRLPSDLLEKQVQNINYNISTNGLNSTEQYQLKM